MKYFSLIILLSLATFLLSGCLYDAPPSRPISQIDTFLLGQWITQDKSGKIFEATIAPLDGTHYHVTFFDKDKSGAQPWEFEGWISRVGNVKFLTLQSLSPDPRYHDKYLFLHYELITAEKDPTDSAGIGGRRIRIYEPQLPSSALHLDSYHLRQAIGEKLHEGTLLLPLSAPLGFSVWTRTGGDITWPKSKI
ncbi:MAG: hypothetical protein ACOYK6_01150 [Chthoniobacterales bacterium]